MQVGGNQDAASAAKNPVGESSAMSADYENLFIDRLVKLAFGDHPEVMKRCLMYSS
jgi:hypothetical protein